MAVSKGKKTQKKQPVDRIKTVSTAVAQYNTLCDQVTQLNVSLMSAIDNFLNDETICIQSRVACELQLLSGCRVSEILNISYTDILTGGKVLVRGLKGSDDRVIHSSRFASYLNICKSAQCNPFEYLSRFMLYRDYKKKGIMMLFKNASYRSVTHALRHLYIEELKGAGLTNENIKTSIGHKSDKSTLHYVEKTNLRTY